MRVVAVYVGQKSQTNLRHRVGLAAGIWGFKKPQPDYDDIRPGDILLLASDYSGGEDASMTKSEGAGEAAVYLHQAYLRARSYDDGLHHMTITLARLASLP